MKTTYNIWCGKHANASAFLATVVATTYNDALKRAIDGCGLNIDLLDVENSKYNNLPLYNGNPLLNKDT